MSSPLPSLNAMYLRFVLLVYPALPALWYLASAAIKSTPLILASISASPLASAVSFIPLQASKVEMLNISLVFLWDLYWQKRHSDQSKTVVELRSLAALSCSSWELLAVPWHSAAGFVLAYFRFWALVYDW